MPNRSKAQEKEPKESTCFVIMPIADRDPYQKGHFKRIYDHLITPACKMAGFKSERADDIGKADYIILTILRKIIESDMVICDLSSHNPNVMYELGIRQAFNKPVVLIKDQNTGGIFDIDGIRYITYQNSLIIDEAQKAQQEIAQSLQATFQQDSNSINSLVQLLGVEPADNPIKRSQSDAIFAYFSEIRAKLETIEAGFNNLHIDTERVYSFSEYVGRGLLRHALGEAFYLDSVPVGIFIGLTKDYQYAQFASSSKNNAIVNIRIGSDDYFRLDTIPF